MPSSMTHTYFGLEVYNNLNKNYQNKIKNALEYYKLFSQGSDPFMFHSLLIGPKANKINKIQKLMHSTKTKEFFINTINYINNNNLLNNPEAMSYLYGHICHYFLDLHTHPFIYYKSGIFNKKDKNTYKYNGLHQKIEYAIDLYYIKNKETTPPHKFKIHNNIYKPTKLTKTLKNIIKASIEDTYSIKNAATIYEKAISHMKFFFQIANYDPYGIKLKLYQLLDKITPQSIIKVNELSFYNKYKEINNWLNLKHKTWYKPWDNTTPYNTSFLDLYDTALKETIITIEEVTKMLEAKQIDPKKLNTLFKDLSYITGLNCNTQVEYKYFEN